MFESIKSSGIETVANEWNTRGNSCSLRSLMKTVSKPKRIRQKMVMEEKEIKKKLGEREKVIGPQALEGQGKSNCSTLLRKPAIKSGLEAIASQKKAYMVGTPMGSKSGRQNRKYSEVQQRPR